MKRPKVETWHFLALDITVMLWSLKLLCSTYKWKEKPRWPLGPFHPPLHWICLLCKAPTFSAAAAAKSLQACVTLCDPIDVSPPGSPIPGILQARTPEWVAISFSSAWKWKVKVKSLSRIRLLATPWTTAYQAPLSVGFSRQEYWSGVPLPSLPTFSSWALTSRFTHGSILDPLFFPKLDLRSLN